MSFKKVRNTYYNIKKRCNNIENPNYWWKWIQCKWTSSEDFVKDMLPSYKDWLTIDRIDSNWNYCKENCKWATWNEQSRNKKNNTNLTFHWITMCLTDWAKKLNINRSTLMMRIQYYWWSIEKALTYKINI